MIRLLFLDHGMQKGTTGRADKAEGRCEARIMMPASMILKETHSEDGTGIYAAT